MPTCQKNENRVRQRVPGWAHEGSGALTGRSSLRPQCAGGRYITPLVHVDVGKVGEIALGEESNLFRVGVTPKVREDVGILCTWAVDAGRAACRIARMQRGVGGNHETHLTSEYGCARG